MAQTAYVDWDGLAYYDRKNKEFIQKTVEPCLKDGGRRLFKDLPSPSIHKLNYTYFILDNFRSNEDFEKPEEKYLAGTVVKVSEVRPGIYRYTVVSVPSDISKREFADLEDKISNLEINVKELQKRPIFPGPGGPNCPPSLGTMVEVHEEAIKTLQQEMNEAEVNINDANKRTDALENKVDDLHKLVGDNNSYTLNKFLRVNSDISKLNLTLISDYYDKHDIDDLIEKINTNKDDPECYFDASLYYTKVETDKLISKTISHYIPNMSDYYTKSEVNGLIPNIDNLVTIEDFKEKFKSVATKNFVKESIENITLPETDLSNYYNKEEVNKLIPTVPSKLSELENDKEFVNKEDLAKSIEHKLNIEDYNNEISKYLKVDDYAKNLSGYTNDMGYTTKEDVLKLIEDIEVGGLDIDLSEYAKKTDIPSLDGYATLTDLNSKADKASTLKGYSITDAYTIDEVDTKLTDITTRLEDLANTTIDLSSYLQKSELANQTLFTEDLVVTNAIGNFTTEENVKDMSLADLFIKLLGLEKPTTPDEPDQPDEPTYPETLQYLIDNQLSSFSGLGEDLKNDGFKIIDGSNRMDSGLYIIEESGSILSTGYQVQTEGGEDGNSPVVLIPSTATIVKLYQFDDGITQTWGELPFDGSYFDYIGTSEQMVNGQTYQYNKYRWNEDLQGGSIYTATSWRFEINL